LYGVAKAVDWNLMDPKSFDPTMYEYYEKVE